METELDCGDVEEGSVWERETGCVGFLEVGQTRCLLGFPPQLCKELSYANNLSVVKYSLSQICDSILSW